MRNFDFASTPRIIFGSGRFNLLPQILESFGDSILLVTGESSFQSSGRLEAFANTFEKRSIRYFHISVRGEPSPDFIDRACAEFGKENICAVVAVGGGSVIDAGKAISAMLPQTGTVRDYLEGVGKEKIHNGVKVPFVAVPTTAGTGSEATKNAVLSSVGPNGFKKSIRHDNFIPDVAVVDPELSLTCPPAVTAACGMDALTQLLESYVSTEADPVTDALALSGLGHIKDSLVAVRTIGARDIDARAKMAYAALISGITLTNAGLGVVHGLASPIGGCFGIPHGVICGTLLASATEVSIEHLKRQGAKEGLVKYARVGALVTNGNAEDIDRSCDQLIKKIHEWTCDLKLPLLGELGIKKSDLDKLAEKAGNKNSPAKLRRDEIKQILLRRL
jgi:alcohol dehydrogenase class IV